MRQNTKRWIAVLLVVLQLFVLLPELAPEANAADAEPETPVLNKTVVGTVKFQSFNFLGDNATGSDGVDYTSTFYYSDDWFSPSAINADADSATMKWSDLKNVSLAATSFDFAVASYASNEGNVKTATSRTWANTDYSDKAKNARSFLTACGFTDFQAYDYNHAPTNDSIAYVIASKPIYVWDDSTQSNRSFTLIAVGVRGAGYGAEWASNVTIGDLATGALPSNGRHWGFDTAAQEVCASVRQYLADHNITENAKYWITGFSRAGATANLVAGYVTDGAASTYHTRQRDVFGYTWECPQGAAAAANNANFRNYKNICNILNGMDAVPKVSPDSFNHERLGVDYYMPYYKNTTTAENEAFYTGMRNVLQTIAVGAYNYAGEYYTEDPLIHITDPSQYPYNRTMRVRTITATQLIGDAIDGVLADNFGTVDATGSNQKIAAKHIDEFIDDLIQVFVVSGAWSGKIGASNTTSALSNRTKFIGSYQNDFRNVLGYLLDYSGPAFLGLVDELIDAVGEQLSLTNTATNIGVGLAFLNFYNYPTSTYVFPTLGIFNDPWVGKISWRNRSRREVLVEEAQPVVKNVIRNMVGNFVDPQGITRTQFESSMDHLVELVVNLYADELSRYNSNYFGTSLYYMWQILCVHEQEVVMSWIKSLDPMHMNRSCRTVTLPAGCSATLYEYRPGVEGDIDDALLPAAPVVAEVKNGAIAADTLKDDRISCTQSNGSIVIRYPASLQIRVDVTSDSAFSAGDVRVADYKTTEAHTNVSAGKQQFEGLPASGYSSVTSTAYTNVTAANSSLTRYDDVLLPGDTLHIGADEITTFDGKNANSYSLLIDKAPTAEIAEYGKTDAGLATGTDAASAVQLGASSAVTAMDTARSIPTRTTRMTVPASSIYYDDELTAGDPSEYAGETARLDQDEEGTVLWYQFRGTRIDLYCTTDDTAGYVMAAVYENNNGELGERIALKTVKSSSDTTRYNVPTISFDGLDAGKDYFLRLYAIAGANYRLDGIRVYHAADETDAAVRAAYEAEAEQDAKYVNLHALLLGSVSEETLSETIEDAAVFYTDSGESYSLASEEYTTISPKNEIYLASGQSVAFQIVGSYEKVMVGMSAPESLSDGGSVRVTDGSDVKTLPIESALDMYYEITPAPDGSVVIRNNGSAMISITNVKLSGVYTPPAEPLNAASSLMVTKSLLHYAADFQAQTAPTPEPTTDLSGMIQQLISRFVERLFSSVTQLFGH